MKILNGSKIMKTISYLDKFSFEALPILPTGSCIFTNLAAQVPVMLDIGKIGDGLEPKSDTIRLAENWKQTRMKGMKDQPLGCMKR